MASRGQQKGLSDGDATLPRIRERKMRPVRSEQMLILPREREGTQFLRGIHIPKQDASIPAPDS